MLVWCFSGCPLDALARWIGTHVIPRISPGLKR